MFSTYITFHGRLFGCFIAPELSFSYHPRVVGSRSCNDFVHLKKKKKEQVLNEDGILLASTDVF